MSHPFPRVIGLYSPAPQSGKSTTAGFLHQFGYTTVPFAAPLKEMTAVLLRGLGYHPEEVQALLTLNKDALLPAVRCTPRHLLQTLGTEWGRGHVHPELWLTCWERTAIRLLAEGHNVVCDDIRFPNEAALVRKLGGQMWHISRPGTENTHSHASEGALDDYPHFDRYLTNDGSIADIYRTIKPWLQLPTPAPEHCSMPGEPSALSVPSA